MTAGRDKPKKYFTQNCDTFSASSTAGKAATGTSSKILPSLRIFPVIVLSTNLLPLYRSSTASVQRSEQGLLAFVDRFSLYAIDGSAYSSSSAFTIHCEPSPHLNGLPALLAALWTTQLLPSLPRQGGLQPPMEQNGRGRACQSSMPSA